MTTTPNGAESGEGSKRPALREVRFPGYQVYVQARAAANNAIMALLAGSHLAAHTLLLTEGSTRPLDELFPAVPHIRRFNLITEEARKLLVDAEDHLGAVTVPYALSIHEAFVMNSIAMMKDADIALKTHKKKISPWNMHEIVFESLDLQPPALTLEIFHLLRCMRNCQIHGGGVASEDLETAISSLSTHAKERWEGLCWRSVDAIVRDGRVTFGTGEIFAAFSITQDLGREVNGALVSGLGTSYWAKIVVEDYVSGTNRTRNSDMWMWGLRNFAPIKYSIFQLSNDELADAARALGRWTRTDNVGPRIRGKRSVYRKPHGEETQPDQFRSSSHGNGPGT
ncbi:hypothetical protein I6A60_02250 [Frankia sp. AgB1.9]|uniref:hypothetical protein n=1 Tax=unclassified Frankia TaxID=2632575 RepID=UPI0019344174|nr:MULTISPECIES: hypothetical protein [unclassified Frankia]MBL7492552.1 hypothetical protein [Frankia sp. AgW1.1]MBL7546707.1 hypothetical protein [Frankia sp. AgB1.9]MBL7622865.1 hypothetical protein [Frankia sp. AgB1.8]